MGAAWLMPLCNVGVIVVCCDADCIDLSKRRVTPQDRAKCEERFKKACLVRCCVVCSIAEVSVDGCAPM